MAAALPFIQVGFAVFGAIQQFMGARNEAKAQASAMAYNAQVAQRNAAVARSQAAADAEAQRRKASQVTGQAAASYGASGITMEGSPLDVLESSAANAELDRQKILYHGELRAMGYEDTAALDSTAAANARSAGNAKAGSALLLGAGKAYDAWPTSKKAQAGYQIGDYGMQYGYDTAGF